MSPDYGSVISLWSNAQSANWIPWPMGYFPLLYWPGGIKNPKFHSIPRNLSWKSPWKSIYIQKNILKNGFYLLACSHIYIYIFHLLVYVSTLKVVTFKRSLYSHVHSLPFTVRLICEALVITEFTGSADWTCGKRHGVAKRKPVWKPYKENGDLMGIIADLW